jgi:hypothetical protein
MSRGITALEVQFYAVLAVDDAHAVLDQLGAQWTHGGRDDVMAEFAIPEREAVPGGHPVWTVGHSVGFGGSCDAWASQDGHAVIVWGASD